MRTRKPFILLGILIGLGLLVGGCGLLEGPECESEAEAGVLRVCTTWSGKAPRLQALFERYAKENGLTVRLTMGVKSDKIEQALNGPTPPEIILLSGSDPVAAYHQLGLVAPLGEWAEQAAIRQDDFFPTALAPCRQGDSLVCLPWVSDVPALYWNKDLFRAAGLDPDRPPQTMEELAEYAAKLTQRDADGKLTQIGFLPDYPRDNSGLYAQMLGGAAEAEAWQQQFYNQPASEEGAPSSKVEDFAKTFDRYRSSKHPVYAGRRLSCQQCHRETPPDGKKLPDSGFAGGKVAMMVSGEWLLGSKVMDGVNYGAAPFPPPAAHPEQTAVVDSAVLLIPAQVKDQAAAGKLLAWLLSPEVAAEAAAITSGLPATRPAAQGTRFQEIPHFQVFLDLLAAPLP